MFCGKIGINSRSLSIVLYHLFGCPKANFGPLLDVSLCEKGQNLTESHVMRLRPKVQPSTSVVFKLGIFRFGVEALIHCVYINFAKQLEIQPMHSKVFLIKGQEIKGQILVLVFLSDGTISGQTMLPKSINKINNTLKFFHRKKNF